MYVCLEYYMRFYTIHKFEIYVCTFHIIFCMVLSTWLHTNFYLKVLMCICAPQFKVQTFSFKFSQIVLAPLQNLFWYLVDVNWCDQQFYKVTLLIYELKLIWNFGKIWKTISYITFQNFSSFDFIKWEILLLSWNHLKLGPEHKMTYNSLSTIPNPLKGWETH
jgi:hypothetical protein